MAVIIHHLLKFLSQKHGLTAMMHLFWELIKTNNTSSFIYFWKSSFFAHISLQMGLDFFPCCWDFFPWLHIIPTHLHFLLLGSMEISPSLCRFNDVIYNASYINLYYKDAPAMVVVQTPVLCISTTVNEHLYMGCWI